MPTVAEGRTLFGEMIEGANKVGLEKRPALIFDIGSYECRAGFNVNPSESPPKHPYLRFKTQVAKPKTMVNRDIDAMHIVGDEFSMFEQSKLNKKTMFDKDIMTHTNNLEHILDYSFSHLGFQSNIEMPVIMTEPLCNPNYCREQVQEIMFECYGLPSVSYTVDSLAGFHHTNANDGLIIQSGNQSTNIIPILSGQPAFHLSKKIPIGGSHHTDLLSKSLALKYP